MYDLAGWAHAAWPLVKLVFMVSVGLFVGNLIEALHWTRFLACLASPLARLGHLSARSAASFAMAFVSGITANTMLAEAYDQGQMSRRELVLSNLFNSLPTYFLHLPSMVFITVPLLKTAAVVYLGLTIGAAMLRSAWILCVGRLILPRIADKSLTVPDQPRASWHSVIHKTRVRFQRRIKKILLITVPIYALVQAAHHWGLFAGAEHFLSTHMGWLSWLPPQAMGILVFQLAAEMSAGMAAAGALLDAGSLQTKEVVLALLVGNIISSPMRAFRHQFPYYAGIYKPALALFLIGASQGLRVVSLMLCAAVYYWLF